MAACLASGQVNINQPHGIDLDGSLNACSQALQNEISTVITFAHLLRAHF